MSLRGFEKSEVIHSIYNFFKNWIATPLLRSARNDNYFYSSLRGFAEAIYSIVDCFITFAHAVRLSAMTIKNNLVKSFLASINFDSLSRKIKSPCLVINKFNFFTQGGNYLMNNFNKIFSYVVVAALVMVLSISCKSNEDPNSGDTKTQERTFSYYAGNWWGDAASEGTETHIITINADGSMVMHNDAELVGDVSIPSSSITKNSDTNYTATVTDASSGMYGQFIFTFSSDTQGTLNIIAEVNASIPITKK